MVRAKQYLERCWTLPSSIAPHEAQQIFDTAMQHVLEHRPASCDAIIEEFGWGLDLLG